MRLRLAEVLRDHWPNYTRKHRARLVTAHYRAVQAVLACRTRVLGGHVYRCESCKRDHFVYHSCNHRSCPECGALDQQRWSATQEARLLPGVAYWLVTFTIPDTLRPLCKQHPAILYDLLLRESAGAMQDLAHTQLGGRLGFTSILHTWGRQLQHHPHVHVIVPAVVFNESTRDVHLPDNPGFFLPEDRLAARFRNRLDIALKRHHPDIHRALSPEARRALNVVKWVVDCEHVGHGKHAVRYLARYVHKTALGANRLAGQTPDGRILLRWQSSDTGKWGTARLSPETLIDRFLTHVLPKGFVRTRHFGWMSGAARKTRLLVRCLICGEIGEAAPDLPEPEPVLCPHCNGPMICIATLDPLVSPRGPPESPASS